MQSHCIKCMHCVDVSCCCSSATVTFFGGLLQVRENVHPLVARLQSVLSLLLSGLGVDMYVG